MKKIVLSTLFFIFFNISFLHARDLNFESEVYGKNNYIYNFSKQPWTFTFSFLQGGVHNINQENLYSHTFTITVEPNQAIPMYFRRSECGSMPGGGPVYCLNGKVTVTDFENKSQCYVIKETWSNAPWIYSKGPVFPVILLNNNGGQNKYGDFTLMRDSWGDSPTQSSFGSTC